MHKNISLAINYSETNGDEIIYSQTNIMHHKVFIIDGKTVVTGSYNPTKGGDERNNENIIVIEDEGFAKRYTDEFNSLMQPLQINGD